VRRVIHIGDKPENAQITAGINDAVDLSTYRLLAPHEKVPIAAMLDHSCSKVYAFLPPL